MTPEAMAALHARCFTLPRPWSADEFAALLATPGVFLLTEAGLGLLMGRVAVDEAELLTLAVDPGARRRGMGGALVARFQAEAAARGADRAFLEVAADNAAALATYGRAGFARAGLRRGYYRSAEGRTVDAVVMTCHPLPLPQGPKNPGPPGI